VYASTRTQELAAVPWPNAQKAAFLAQQSALQRAHYRRHYAGAEFLVILLRGTPAGRVYVHRSSSEVRLMDIALLPSWRGHGIGAALSESLLAHADALGLPVSLHVEPFNRVRAYYERLGFRRREERGIYWLMERAVS
jgi:ribosomal protein S18 acetylase RimI-like enzyme